jgi:hypothetical protein
LPFLFIPLGFYIQLHIRMEKLCFGFSVHPIRFLHPITFKMEKLCLGYSVHPNGFLHPIAYKNGKVVFLLFASNCIEKWKSCILPLLFIPLGFCIQLHIRMEKFCFGFSVHPNGVCIQLHLKMEKFCFGFSVHPIGLLHPITYTNGKVVSWLFCSSQWVFASKCI